MTKDDTSAARMMRLFEGYAGAHGTHGDMKQNGDKGGKQEIKATARTVREPVTLGLWELHLRAGTPVPLGIIPIREDSQCVWGCIDIDKYDIDPTAVAKLVKQNKLPLVVCRTKSGGVHVFLFLKQAVPAEVIRAKLRMVAAGMGWGDSEIFPKQNQVLAERGDIGNWLNMPYLGGDSTTRYAVKDTVGGMTLREFLDYAEKRRVDINDVPDIGESEDETLDDGPPCLQHLTTVGFPEGTRNNGLFGMGIFCKKKYGEQWRQMLEQYNREYMTPPLAAEEVLEVIKNLEKKDYQYRCNDAPCVSYCNAALCRTRKYGVGGGDTYPTISGVSKMEAGSSTLWFVDINEKRIELSTPQLQNYKDFQARCIEELNVFFMPMKMDTWARTVNAALKDVHFLEAAPEMSPEGHFLELLEDFCMNRHRGETVEDLWLGKPWQDPDTGRHYFRLKDLMDHLDKAKFREWGRPQVASWLCRAGGRHFFNIKGKGCNTFWVPDNFTSIAPLDLPPAKRDPI